MGGCGIREELNGYAEKTDLCWFNLKTRVRPPLVSIPPV